MYREQEGKFVFLVFFWIVPLLHPPVVFPRLNLFLRYAAEMRQNLYHPYIVHVVLFMCIHLHFRDEIGHVLCLNVLVQVVAFFFAK